MIHFDEFFESVIFLAYSLTKFCEIQLISRNFSSKIIVIFEIFLLTVLFLGRTSTTWRQFNLFQCWFGGFHKFVNVFLLLSICVLLSCAGFGKFIFLQNKCFVLGFFVEFLQRANYGSNAFFGDLNLFLLKKLWISFFKSLTLIHEAARILRIFKIYWLII